MRLLNVWVSELHWFITTFANKEDIFNELAVTYRDGLEEEIRQHISFEGSLLQNVINILVTYKDYIRSHKDLYDTFREVELSKKDLIRDYYQRITHLIAQVLPTDFSNCTTWRLWLLPF